MDLLAPRWNAVSTPVVGQLRRRQVRRASERAEARRAARRELAGGQGRSVVRAWQFARSRRTRPGRARKHETPCPTLCFPPLRRDERPEALEQGTLLPLYARRFRPRTGRDRARRKARSARSRRRSPGSSSTSPSTAGGTAMGSGTTAVRLGGLAAGEASVSPTSASPAWRCWRCSATAARPFAAPTRASSDGVLVGYSTTRTPLVRTSLVRTPSWSATNSSTTTPSRRWR